MMRWIAGLGAALLLPACGGGGSGKSSVATPDGSDPGGAPQLPAVRIISPDSGTSVPEGSTVTIQAEVTDPNASIERVDFYDNNQRIGSASSPPYELSYGKLKSGGHQLCAVGIDNEGNTIASSPVTLFVVQGDGDRHGHGRDR